MEGLFTKVSSVKMSRKDITRLTHVLDTKRRKLEQTELETVITEAKTQPMPQEWLKDAVANFNNIKHGIETDLSKSEALNDDEFLDQCIYDTHCNEYFHRHCVAIKEESPNCISNDCWYDNNEDRIDEHRETYYYVFDPDYHYCDVCFANGPDFTLVDFPTEQFIPELRAEIKIKKGV